MIRNNLIYSSRSQDRTMIMKGLFLSLLVVSSTIPFFLMVPEATPALAVPSVISTIPGFSVPSGIAYDPVNQRMYVANFGVGTNTISVIDTNSDSITGTPISVGLRPVGAAYDPVHERIYVANQISNTVSVIDTNTNMVVGDPIPVGSGPSGITYDSANERMYVTNQVSFTVSVIDTNTNMVVGDPIPVGNAPNQIVYDFEHSRVYVGNLLSDTVSVIDTNTNMVVGSPIPVGDGPIGLGLDPIHDRIYVGNQNSDTVSVIDTNTNMVVGSPIPVGDGPNGVTYDPVNQRMYVANLLGNTVTVIDTNTNMVVGSPIPVGTLPVLMAYDPDQGRIYVSNRGTNTVSVIQITTAITTIDSATDGNNNPLTDGGRTPSDEITFTFTGTATAPTTVASFECSLDDSAFAACTSPQTLTGLTASEHTFAVRAVDNDGNRQVPPSTFTWTVEEESDPATAIRDLISDIRSLNGVNFGVKISLITQLRLALIFVSDNNPSNDFISCALMTSFTTSVNTLEIRGLLTEQQALFLLQQAQVIQNAIGCNIGALSAATSPDADGVDLSSFSSSGTENTNNIPLSALSLPY